MAVDKKLEAYLAKKKARGLAAKQLKEGIPGLEDMCGLEAYGEIDLFLKTWQNPCSEFNPYTFYQHLRRCKQLGL